MSLERRMEELIYYLENNYNRLSEREVMEISMEIESIDNYILECRLMNEM